MSSLYRRFIPREELGDFALWQPGRLAGGGGGTAAAAPLPAEPIAPEPRLAPAMLEELTRAAHQAGHEAGHQAGRQAGYDAGYEAGRADGRREGLAALEEIRQRDAAELGARFAEVAAAFGQRLAEVEQHLAGALAGVATEIARQVVRDELATRPALVEAVAREALAALVGSARQVRVRLHPDDHRLLAGHAGLDLDAHHARLVEDAAVSRGGCVVDCDVGRVDASIETRWRRAAAAVGGDAEWRAGPAAAEAAGAGGEPAAASAAPAAAAGDAA